MKELPLITLILLGMITILMVFIGLAFRGRRGDAAFGSGFLLSMFLIIANLILYFLQFSQTLVRAVDLATPFLLGMAAILLIFIGISFRGARRTDHAFANGLFLSTIFIIIAFVVSFMQFAQRL